MRFNYFEPSSIKETVDALHQGQGNNKILAGGTDIIIRLRRQASSYQGLVNIKQLPDLATFSTGPRGGLSIGAVTRLRSLETSTAIRERFPVLLEAIQVIGSLQLRNMATIGGNLCNASPSADSAPALIATGATATFIDDGGNERTVPIQRLFVGPGSSLLGSTGLLLRIDVPEPAVMTGNNFERLTPRNAMDIAIVSAASQLTLEPTNGKVRDVSIALGAVAPTPVQAPRAEDILRNREPTSVLLAKAATMAMEECNPIDDIRGSASYRRAMVGVLVRRTLERAFERAQKRR
ncbi:MAG: xanthine dehydrogenase family protein subunit M [Arenicellales bacterium]|jgi:carbon-monoxide dehydrogenase medium subunit|nr:xanthine dehydrogenase family protein subunit M [Arenicellales bacterium]|tara:strand:+ start:563 stop:1441 length:879 start_codon:yes stop_codon:yes gene_type:complete